MINWWFNKTMWKEIQLIKITLIFPLLEFSIRCHNCHPPKLEQSFPVTQQLIYDVQLSSAFRKLTGTILLFPSLCLLNRKGGFSPIYFHQDSMSTPENKHVMHAFTAQWDPGITRTLTPPLFCKSNLHLLQDIGCISKVSHDTAQR